MTARTGKYRATVKASRWGALAVVALAILFRLALLCTRSYPFNSDEAIVALMGRHILSGRWPVFFYGQAYMGSLDATFVSLGFLIFGQEIWVIRLVQSILFLGILLTSMRLSTRLAHNKAAGLVTGLLLAIPTVNLNLYTTISLGGYGEALLIGNLLLLLGLKIRERARDIWLLGLWGIMAGIGLWAFSLTLIYTIPTLIFILLPQSDDRDKKGIIRGLALISLGFVLGAAPIGFWLFRNGPTSFIQELFGEAIAGTAQGGYWTAVFRHILNFLIFGVTAILGFRPPWSTRIFFWPFAIVVSLFWIAAILQYVRVLRGKESHTSLARLLGGVAVFLVAGFILTPFGGDPSGRYFIPLSVILTILAGSLFIQDTDWLPRWFKWGLFCAVIAYHLSSNLQVVLRSESGFTTQFDAVARIDHSYDDDLQGVYKLLGRLPAGVQVG
jgi:hypothetical protein